MIFKSSKPKKKNDLREISEDVKRLLKKVDRMDEKFDKVLENKDCKTVTKT